MNDKPQKTYTPVKKSFVYFHIIQICISFLLISSIVTPLILIFFQPVFAIIFVGFVLLICGYSIILRFFQFSKEKYELYNDRIIRYGGGIFSQFQTELIYKNVTNIEKVKPFIQYYLFKTGMIRIESAGSSLSQVYLQHITNEDNIFAECIKSLQQNNFSLKRKKIIAQEKPQSLGIVFDQSKEIFFSIIGLLILILSISPIVFFEFIRDTLLQPQFLIWTIIGFTLILIFLFVRFMTQFISLKMKLYTVFDDCICYEKLAFTKRVEYIPFENIADAHVTQSFTDRLFGIYTLIISSQGSQNNITFSYVPNGTFVQNEISRIAKTFDKPQVSSKVTQKKVAKTVTKKESAQKKETLFSMQMYGPRAYMKFIPAILLFLIPILWPILALIVIPEIIRIKNTVFRVTSTSVQSSFSFIQKRDTEFQDRRVTAVVYKEDIIDKLFGTCSVEFWSIGSNQTLKFEHIKKDAKLISYIKKQHGFTDTKPLTYEKPEFHILQYVSRYSIFFIALILVLTIAPYFFSAVYVILASILIGSLIVLRGIVEFFQATVSHIQTHQKYLLVQKGIFIKKQHYVKYDNIKGRTDLKYPLSQAGTVQIDIAGEQVEKQGNQQYTKKNAVTIPYIQECFRKNLHEKKDSLSQMIKPSPKNVLFLSTIFILTIPLLPYVYAYMKKKYYEIRTEKICEFTGVFYKKRLQIYYSMFDHIETAQGVTHKLFKNGSIYVYTTGSSSVNLAISDIYDHQKIAKDISKKYL
ncbi:MAG: PH domain-containing protein [Candidatus Woesearchaeota archaeon]